MSRRHSIRAQENTSVAYDIEHLSPKDLQALYGIQFIEDPDSKSGRVFDPVLKKEFPNLMEWLAEQAQEGEWSEMGSEYEEEYGYLDEY